MLFIDDEIPRRGLLAAVADARDREGVDCAGGRVDVVIGFPAESTT